ncbi:restriction endonuclease subunit S [Acinetobacter sp. YH12224]|uniref:restriction endonuclease subunit S n=1 Tax=unclassified Acinetobacter TaxID=196816 RepID=UPI0035A0AE49
MFKNILLLEDYLEFITYGFTNPMPDSDTGPWKVTAKDIVNGKINFTTARKTTQVAYEQKLTNKSRPKVDDILLTKDGSLGRLAIVKNENLCVNQSVAVLRVNNKILPEYLYYLLSSPKYQSQMLGEADGTVIKHIYITRVAKMEVDIPSLEEQRKVIKILKSLDQKNNLNNQINQTLESIAQAIFKSWFIDFDPVRAKIAAKQEGKDAELAAMCAISGKSEEELKQMSKDDFAELQATAALFPDELVETELGEVPKGWEYKKLKDLCRVINGRAYKNTEFKEEGIPIVRIQNLTGGGKTVFSDLDLPQDKLIEKEDFIYAWSATFGPYIWRGPKSIYHYHIWKMDVDETIISRYFLYLTMFRKTESMKSSGTGSIFTHLTKAIMESQDVLIADNAINMLFKDRIDRIFKLISLKSDEINNLENIRDTLLPKLLSGEIDVSDLGSETEYEYSTK